MRRSRGVRLSSRWLALLVMGMALLAWLALPLLAARAQVEPEYAIRDIRSGLSADGRTIIVDFVVVNEGRETELPETARLYDESGVEIAARSIPRLAANERFAVRFEVPTARFPAGGQERLIVTVGLETLPPPDQQQLRPDVARISVLIPDLVVQGTPAPGTIPPVTDTDLAPPVRWLRDALARFGVTLDLNSPLQTILLGVIAVIAALLVYVIILIVRTIFRRPPTFPTWQPPYLYSSLIDPNSTPGRRQMWQQHAQSDLLPPCLGGGYAARKVLTSSDGVKLGNWRVTAMRAVQYDMYGRVNRSTAVAPKSAVSRVDRALRRAVKRGARFNAKSDGRRATRTLKPGARALVNALIKKVGKRSLMLPVAVDLRLTGAFGEVRITFELYECTPTGWRMLDAWNAELNMISGIISENFTYTLYGQRPDEPRKAFRARLTDDLTTLLLTMITPPAPPVPAQTSTPTTGTAIPAAPVTQEVSAVPDNEVDEKQA